MDGEGDFFCAALLSRICLSLLVNVDVVECCVTDAFSADANGTTDIRGRCEGIAFGFDGSNDCSKSSFLAETELKLFPAIISVLF